MAVYTVLPNETIAELIEHEYAIGRFSYALGIAQGVENTNYLIGVEQDGHEVKYILTLYEKRVSPEDLPFFMGLMGHLQARGIPCPQPVMRRDGAVVGQVAGKHAAMVTFLPGQSRTVLRNAHLASLGEMTARLHVASQQFPFARANSLSLAGWEGLFVAMGSRLDTIEPGLAELVASEIAYLNRRWPHDLPAGVIHADLFPDNVFFEGEQVSGVIDFYFACTDALAYDLAITVNAWCFEGKAFNVTKARLFFEAYRSVRPLSPHEIDALPVLMRGAALRFLLTRAYDALHGDAEALVTPKNPLEYARKLAFHRSVQSSAAYGLDCII